MEVVSTGKIIVSKTIVQGSNPCRHANLRAGWAIGEPACL